MPSLLDRLIDPEADGTTFKHGYSVQQMVAAVYRDLEELLNTRQTAQDDGVGLLEWRELQRN